MNKLCDASGTDFACSLFILSENIGWIQYADGLDYLFVWVLDCTTVADLFLDSMANVYHLDSMATVSLQMVSQMAMLTYMLSVVLHFVTWLGQILLNNVCCCLHGEIQAMKSCFKVLLSWDKANVFTFKILLIPGFPHTCIVVVVLVRSKLLVFHDSCLSNSFLF